MRDTRSFSLMPSHVRPAPAVGNNRQDREDFGCETPIRTLGRTWKTVGSELIASADNSTADAIVTKLFYDHVRRVQAFVRSHHPSADVDDVVSETFLIAWRKSAEIEPGKEAAWLLGVARNVIHNNTRSRLRRTNFTDALIAARPRTTTSLGDDDLLAEDVDALQEAFGKLRTDDQEILLLAVWQGLSGDELATVLGTSNRRATDRLHRARKRLRKSIDQSEEES